MKTYFSGRYAVAEERKKEWVVTVPPNFFRKVGEPPSAERVIVERYAGEHAGVRAVATASNMNMAFAHGLHLERGPQPTQP